MEKTGVLAMGLGKRLELGMKNLFIGNSAAWLRLGAAIIALAVAAQVAQSRPGAKNGHFGLASLPKPGSVQEW